MKKIIAFTLALVMVMALAGCANSGISVNINAGATTAPAAAATNAATEASEAVETTAAALPDETKPVAPVETEPQETEPAPTEPEEAADILGETEGDTYTNEFLGFRCVMEGFNFKTEVELYEYNGLSANATVADLVLKAKGESGACVFYASTADSRNTANIMVNIGNPSEVQSLELKESLVSVIDTLVTTYESMGFTNVTCEYSEVEIGSNTFDGLVMSAEIAGQNFALVMFMYTGENFVATVTMGGLDADEIMKVAETVEVI